MQRILLVEDEAHIRDAVKLNLELDGYEVVATGNGRKALELYASQHFDLLLLDVMLPEVDGFDITEKVRLSNMEVPILLLTAKDMSQDRVLGLKKGADDYMEKPYQPAELMARVRALHRRSAHRVTNAVMIHGKFECHLKARTAFRDSVHIPLSPKEFELFRYFMVNAGETVTREMLLREVWHMNFDPQTNVVDVNIGRLRRKLEEGFATPALETVWGVGYRLTEG